MKHTTVSAIACVLLANIGCIIACGPRPQLRKREFIPLDKRDEQLCGPGYGRCPSGLCCSEDGYCGNDDPEYCSGSQCQIDYSDACDTFSRPPGTSTDCLARPKIGRVPYGSLIQKCVKPGMMALTFDDGPYDFTIDMLDKLDRLGVIATFFIAGNNRAKGHIDDPSKGWIPILKRMYNTGHHIGSHTWTHRDLNEVNATVRRSEVINNEMAFRNIFGWFPAYLRAPYLSCESGCLSFLKGLGYHVIDINVDTKDYENDDPQLIQISKDRFSNAVSTDASRNSYIVLSHDVQEQTVYNLTDYMVQTARARGYRLVTIGECLGDPKANWYRPAPQSGPGQCGSSVAAEASTVSSPTSSASSENSATPSATSSSSASIDSGPLDSASSAPTASSLPATSASATSEPDVASSSSASASTSSASAGGAYKISRDQKCGGSTGQTCNGSDFGNCCSSYGFCGSSVSYCGTGCDVDFGVCNPRPGGISATTNGLCGTKYSATCANYGDKTCCSAFGFCGNTADHCGTGCQKGYGECT